MSSCWQPLFDPRETGPFLEVAREVVRRSEATFHRLEDPSLAGGRAGLTLLYAYLCRLEEEKQPRYRELAVAGVSQLLSDLSDLPMGPSLHGGMAGLGWVHGHVRELLEDLPPDINDQIDEVIGQVVQDPPWKGPFDLIHGLVGYGIYALGRLPSPKAARSVAAICQRLQEMARLDSTGAAWWTQPEFSGAWIKARFPNGAFDLGVAHGVPGVIGFLSAALGSRVASPGAAKLLTEAVGWLLARESAPVADRSRFASTISPEKTHQYDRLSWCYGDPGIASTLVWAGRSASVPSWERKGLALALECARRSPERAELSDVGLCHGAAGLAHLFNRLLHVTGKPVFREAARFWFRWALEKVDEAHLNDPNFLEGGTGTALAFLAAVSDLEPRWDRVLLLSYPFSRGRR